MLNQRIYRRWSLQSPPTFPPRQTPTQSKHQTNPNSDPQHHIHPVPSGTPPNGDASKVSPSPIATACQSPTSLTSASNPFPSTGASQYSPSIPIPSSGKSHV